MQFAMRKTICRKVRATHIHVKKCIKKRKPTKLCIEKKEKRGLKYRKILLNNFSVGQGSFSLIHHSFISP